LGKTQVVANFLLSPSELAFREKGVKITLSLSKKALSFSSLKLRNITPNLGRHKSAELGSFSSVRLNFE
jgi:hypothetical protein